MGRWIFVIAAVAALAACKKQRASGLAPAQDWNADQTGMEPPQTPQTANPHAGMDPNNPHAGLDMGGATADNPHGGTDVGALGLPPPDPNRKIDPTHHVKGVISVDRKVADRMSKGGVVFVSIRRADGAGQPVGGPPLAVAKLTYEGADMPFELGEGQAMIGGTELTGDVVVSARYDQDQDAMSKQPGDVVGSKGVKIPADNVKIVLDTVL
jgi:hypothetical protein